MPLFEFDIAALFIHAINIWHFAVQKHVPDGSNRYYLQMMCLSMLATIASIAISAATRISGPAIPSLFVLYSGLRLSLLFAASLYFITQTAGSSVRLLLTAFFITVCVMSAATVLPAAFHPLPGLRYPEAHPVYISVKLGMLSTSGYFVIKKRNLFSKSGLLFFGFAAVLLFASSFADAVNPAWVTGNLAIALSVLIVQLSILDNSDMIDEQTGLINGKGLRFLLREVFRQENACTLVLLGSEELSRIKGYIDAQSVQAIFESFTVWLASLRERGVRLCVIQDGLYAFFFPGTDPAARKKSDYSALLFAEKLSNQSCWNWKQQNLSIDIPFRVAVLHCPSDCSAVEEVDDFLGQFNDLPELAGNRLIFFGSDFRHGKKERDFAITSALDRMLAQNTIELRFQPIVSIASQRIIALETLAGITLDNGEWIWQSEIYRIADRIGLGPRLFDTILYESCKWYTANKLCSLGIGQLQIRLTGSKCIGLDWAVDVKNTAERARIPLECLCLELTEQVVIGAKNTVLPNIQRLIGLGVSLAIDDFGSGYSDYGELFEIPFNMVKLDKKILRAGDIDIRRARLLAGTFTMFRKKGISLTCEGVETAREAAMLATLGCTEMQGFLFGAPQTGDRVIEQIQANI